MYARRLADGLGGRGGTAAGEHGQAREQQLLVGRQQVVAPVDCRAKRVLAFGQVAGAAARELQRQEREELGGRVLARARGRELDRQREAVEPAADLGDLVCLLARPAEAGRDRGRARDEEPRRVAQRQRRDAVLVLGREAERRRLVTSKARSGAAASSSASSGAASSTCSKLSRRGGPALVEVALQRLLLRAERLRDLRLDERGIAKRREVDEVDAVGEGVRELVRGLHREPGLARPARAGQREEAHAAAEEGADLVELASAADELGLCAGRWRRARSSAARHGTKRRGERSPAPAPSGRAGSSPSSSSSARQRRNTESAAVWRPLR